MRLLCLYLLFTVPAAINAQWGADSKLSTNEVSARLNENMGQCIVASGNTVHAVWADVGNNGSAIYYKRSLDGGQTWGADTRLSGTPGSDQFPLMALSGSNLHLVFFRDSGTAQSASYYKRSTDGGNTWGPDVLLGNTKWWPGVACSGSSVYVSLNTVIDTNSEVFFRRSTDNGTTWEPQQQISNAPGRSEDPAIAANGPYVDLVWNDNRDVPPGTGMAVYYRRSADMGATWGPETALTQAPAYTYFPTIFLDGSNAEVAFGDRQSGHYDIYHLHSSDSGSTWAPKEQITNTAGDEFYPCIVRDGPNLHLSWGSPAGIIYQYSATGGTTWAPSITLTTQGSSPFMAVAKPLLHIIFTSQRNGHSAIYYKRNPTGDPDPPKLSILRSGNDILLSVPTLVGHTYRLEQSPDLSAISWGTLADNIAGTGGTLQITDTNAVSRDRRFFRVIVLQ